MSNGQVASGQFDPACIPSDTGIDKLVKHLCLKVLCLELSQIDLKQASFSMLYWYSELRL